MSRNKQRRFKDNQESDNVVEQGKEWFEKCKGNWNEFFGNENPLTLEVGCGRGEYTLGLSKKFPEVNHIGIDIKGSRIWKGSQLADEATLKNAAFLRTDISFLATFFDKDEVDEIWVTFPDPRPRDRDEKHRLVSPRYLDIYRQFLKPGGYINLKTDNFALYSYALGLVRGMGLKIDARTCDLYESRLQHFTHDIQTTYEKKFLSEGVKINYLRFTLEHEQ